MTLFAALLIILAAPKDSLTSFVCNYAGGHNLFARLCQDVPPPPIARSDELVAARITSGCLDSQGLKLSVAFDEPVAGASNIQVFTTGEDYFPSEQGISDSFRMSLTIPDAADHLDITIPVDRMPVGEQIFGNIMTRDEGISSFVAFSMYVPDCSVTSVHPPELTPDDLPVINSATCLPSRQLMIAFEFQGLVLGQHRALVDDRPYQLASVINQPAMLFFAGEPPPAGPILIRLISATDGVTVYEETYTPPVCDAN